MNIIKTLFIVVALALNILASSQLFAQTADVPKPLEPWVDWVLYHDKKVGCPYLYNVSERECKWPSRLKLDLNNSGGTFTQQWHIYNDSLIVLPGSADHWPLDVNVNGKEAIVQSDGDTPHLRLSKGKHTITGQFKWNKLPKSLAVLPASGLIDLKVNNKSIARPSINSNGQLWLLQSSNDKISEDNVDLQVFRRINDGHPIQVETILKLRVSGKQRNASFDSPLLNNFIPTQIVSNLLARLESDNQLKVQLRPGEWSITIIARAPSDVVTFTMPKLKQPWPNQEVWVFANDNNMRQVQVTGVTSIDPNQTSLPKQWKNLPAYLMTADETLKLDVTERGITNLKRNELTLSRDMWLDFDGKGYSVRDSISGKIEDTRLTVLPSIELGRVSINNQPQFITRETDKEVTGVEIRHKNLNLNAESRYNGSSATLPANGWGVDLQQVDAHLHLPPGWQVLAVTGADNLPNTWIEQWTLLDLFLVIIIIMSIRHFFGWRWAIVSAFALALTWQERNAPTLIWLNLLAITALLSVLHKHKIAHLLEKYRWATFAVLGVIMLTYMFNTIRVSIYPQLDRGYTQTWQSAKEIASYNPINKKVRMQEHSTSLNAYEAVEEIVVTGTRQVSRSPLNQKRITANIVDGLSGQPSSKINLQQIDPNSQIQSGPGLPTWTGYRSINMSWSGPVKTDQLSKIFLLGPKANFAWRLLGIILLLSLSYCFIKGHTKDNNDDANNNKKSLLSWVKSFKNVSAALALFLMLPMFVPEPTLAQAFPDEDMLIALEERVNVEPDCFIELDQCAQVEKMSINVSANLMQLRLRVHAAIATAIPLPASQDTWLPTQILIDGNPASAFARDADQTIWLSLETGIHDVFLSGPMLQRASFPLALPLEPHFSSWSSNDKSWDIEGIDEDGTSSQQIQLTRVVNESNKDSFDANTNLLPTFIKVERKLRLGLDWYVDTVVSRISPQGVPLNINIPLLANEQILDDELKVENNQVALNFGANVYHLRWTSRLNPDTTLSLVAASNKDYLEVWSVDASPMWHVNSEGLPVNRFTKQADPLNPGKQLEVPVWQPWPGETLTLNIDRPKGVDGQTVTIQNSLLSVSAGKRVNNVNLFLSIRSSRGIKHQIKLPENADVQELDIDNEKQRVQIDNNLLSLTLKPGQQDVIIKWREPSSNTLRYQFPAVDLQLPSVNAHSGIQVSRDRWVIWANGPLLGPAVLFWSVLSVLLVLSIALGWSKQTPLNILQWFLLAIGLSQTLPALIMVVVVCFISLSIREKLTIPLSRFKFNFMQVSLVFLCILSIFIMVGAVANGLLGRPDMQISGNGSSSYLLKWYQDRVSNVLPQPNIISVPILVYRILMLLWAMWLATSLLKWMKWGWKALTTGEFWMKKPETEPKEKIIAESASNAEGSEKID